MTHSLINHCSAHDSLIPRARARDARTHPRVASRWRQETGDRSKNKSYVCLWLLVVETLIMNIISQRARAMMTKIDPNSVNADGVMYRWRRPLALAVAE